MIKRAIGIKCFIHDYSYLGDDFDIHIFHSVKSCGNGFRYNIYQHSFRQYRCNICGKITKEKFKWITLPNDGRNEYVKIS